MDEMGAIDLGLGLDSLDEDCLVRGGGKERTRKRRRRLRRWGGETLAYNASGAPD